MTCISPGSTIGILGGGQLGRMLAIAAAEMGYRVHIYSSEPNPPAGHVADQVTIGAYDDVSKLGAFAASVEVITYEFENIPHAPVAEIATRKPVYPSPDILQTSQHRLREKAALNAMGIATTPFAGVSSKQDLEAAVDKLGFPAVLKTCTMGYDGKGQWMLTRHPREGGDLGLHGMLPEIPTQAIDDAHYILEGYVDFTMEISVIIARGHDGRIACYPPVENRHEQHILAETIAPARISQTLKTQAEAMARTIAEGLQLVGLMAIEMFVTRDGTLLVNELAPRPHNSGHWTIDAAITSQFEQTVRAICGLPLGDPTPLCDARMLNLIGDQWLEWPNYLANPRAKLHLYGKAESRLGRKMGHVTVLE